MSCHGRDAVFQLPFLSLSFVSSMSFCLEVLEMLLSKVQGCFGENCASTAAAIASN